MSQAASQIRELRRQVVAMAPDDLKRRNLLQLRAAFIQALEIAETEINRYFPDPHEQEIQDVHDPR